MSASPMDAILSQSKSLSSSENSSDISAESVAQTYGFYAPFYDWCFGAVLEPGRKALTKAARELQPKKILEMGVGTGLTLNQYPASSEIVGVDISEDMLKIARTRAAKLADRKIQLLAVNAEKLDFPDGSFDCVAVPYVLSVTPNPDRLVAEIRRVCKKEGTIFILNHFSGSQFWWFLERAVRSFANRIGFRSDFSFESQILKYSWQVQEIQQVNLFGLSKLVRIKN